MERNVSVADIDTKKMPRRNKSELLMTMKRFINRKKLNSHYDIYFLWLRSYDR